MDSVFDAIYSGHSEQTMDDLSNDSEWPNLRDPDGSTLLFWLVEGNQTEAVKMLLSYPGLDVNLTNTMGQSPLYVAAVNGNVELATRLINHGALVTPNIKESVLRMMASTYEPRTLQPISSGQEYTIDWNQVMELLA